MNPQQPNGPYPPYNPNQQQYPPAPQPQMPQSQYDFIMNPRAPGGRRFGSGSMVRRLLIAGGGLTILVIIVIVAVSFIGGSSGSVPPLIGIAQDQTELMRVAGLAQANTNNQDVLNFALTTKLSMLSSQQQLLSYMAKNGQKASDSTLALKKSTATDQRLGTATANSTFDTEFTAVVQSELKTYMNDLQTAYKATSGPKGRELLSSSYNGAELLVKQSAQ